jgi:NAD(P)H-nitrite reductase large subunit
MRLEERFRNRELPAKLKIGVSGCPFCCAESHLRDIGVFGKKNGWTFIVGGNAGGRPRVGDVLAQDVSADRVEDLCERFLNFYRKHSRKKERTARFVERVGVEAVRAAVLG